MKIYTDEEIQNRPYNNNAGWEEDERGQVVIYTGIYRWSDSTFRSERDPNFKQGMSEVVRLDTIA